MGMKVERKKNGCTFVYTGGLEKALDGAKAELRKKLDSPEREFLKWQYERAKKAYDKYEQRVKDLCSFIDLAEKELKKREEAADNG